MLLWQMILRDAETLLESPDTAWGWFEQHSPGMWVKADEDAGRPQPDRLWTAEAWEECRHCVENLKLLVRVKDDPDSIPQPFTWFLDRFVNRYLSRHTRPEIQVGPNGPERVTSFFHSPGGHRAHFYNLEHPDDCPGAFWAYVFLSVVDQQVVPLRGGGHCEDCGKLLGMTPGGRPQTGLCAACRQRQYRSRNPEGAKKANRIHNKKYLRRKAKQKHKRKKNSPPTKPT